MKLQDARYEIFRAELLEEYKRMEAMEAMNDNARTNDLGRLNEALFSELENLRSVDPTDRDGLAAEVQRAKAVEGIAKTIIDNANTVLDATRMRAGFAKESVTMPKMLEG